MDDRPALLPAPGVSLRLRDAHRREPGRRSGEVTIMRTASATLALLLAACIPGWPVDPADLPDAPEPADPEPSDEPCEGVPSVGADDPCCPVHQCLAGAGVFACLEADGCRGLADADVVCGDQVCAGLECSSCDPACAPALGLAEQFVDSFDGDVCAALTYVEPEFPACIGAAKVQEGCP